MRELWAAERSNREEHARAERGTARLRRKWNGETASDEAYSESEEPRQEHSDHTGHMCPHQLQEADIRQAEARGHGHGGGHTAHATIKAVDPRITRNSL